MQSGSGEPPQEPRAAQAPDSGTASGDPPRCPVCGGERCTPSFVKDGFAHFDCRGCRTLFLHPVPSAAALARHYQARPECTRSSQCWERDAPHTRHYEALWDRALGQIEAGSGVGPLLDVGCGGGQFLAFAGGRGWDALEGIEPSPPAAAAARERTGAAVHEADFLGAELAPDRYAGITLWNVIEHAASPRAFVRQAARLLRPGGVFVADCPNRDGLTLRLIGDAAYVVMPPEHLTYFSHRSLRTLLVAEGLRVRSLSSNTIYVNDWVRHLGRIQEESKARRSHLAWYTRFTRFRAFLWGIALANLVLGLTRLGDQLLVVAQKPRT